MAIGALNVAGYKRLTASANVLSGYGATLGIFCASQTVGTVQLFDDAATGTTLPITGVITLVAGQFFNIPVAFGAGLNVVITGTADVTVMVN